MLNDLYTLEISHIINLGKYIAVNVLQTEKPSSVYIGPRKCQKILWKILRTWWHSPWLSEEETYVFTAADQKPGQVPGRPGSHLGLLHKSTFPATELEGNAWCGRGIPCAAVMHSTTRAYPRHPRSGTRSVNVVANRETQRATVFDCNSTVQVVAPQKGQAHWVSIWLPAYSLR